MCLLTTSNKHLPLNRYGREYLPLADGLTITGLSSFNALITSSKNLASSTSGCVAVLPLPVKIKHV